MKIPVSGTKSTKTNCLSIIASPTYRVVLSTAKTCRLWQARNSPYYSTLKCSVHPTSDFTYALPHFSKTSTNSRFPSAIPLSGHICNITNQQTTHTNTNLFPCSRLHDAKHLCNCKTAWLCNVSGPMVRHNCHGLSISTHPSPVNSSF